MHYLTLKKYIIFQLHKMYTNNIKAKMISDKESLRDLGMFFFILFFLYKYVFVDKTK